MKQENFIVPERIERAPDWLLNHDDENDHAKLQAEIANDLIAIGFWKMVDIRVRTLAIQRANKEIPKWVRTLPPEKQKPGLQELFAQIEGECEKEVTELMGKDYYARARMLADGADQAFDKATRLMETMEQAQTSIALWIKEKGLLPYMEMSSIGEFLLTKRAKWDGEGSRPGSWYETEFMVDTLIPTLEANGYSRELIVGVAKNFYKARYAIPYLRTVLKEVTERANEIKLAMKDTEDADELALLDKALTEAMQVDTRVNDILEQLIIEINTPAAQGGMSNLEFRKKMGEITHGRKQVIKSHGISYATSVGGVLYIKAESIGAFNAVQRLVENMVDWHQGSPEDMVKDSLVFLQNKTI